MICILPKMQYNIVYITHLPLLCQVLVYALPLFRRKGGGRIELVWWVKSSI